jgi:hypothetical protein
LTLELSTPLRCRTFTAEFDLDLLECIAFFINLKTLGRLRQVNREWRSAFYSGGIVERVLCRSDYITIAHVLAMVPDSPFEFRKDLVRSCVDGIDVVRGRDVRLLVHKHGLSWEKMARVHSAETAMRLSFHHVPIPPHVTGELRSQERQMGSRRL